MESQPRQVEGAVEFTTSGESNRVGHERELRIGQIILGIEGVSQVLKTAKNKQSDRIGVDLAVGFNSKSPYFELKRVFLQVKQNKEEARRFRRGLGDRHGLSNDELKVWLKQNRRVILVDKAEDLVIEDFHSQVQGILDYKRDREDFSYLLEEYPGF